MNDRAVNEPVVIDPVVIDARGTRCPEPVLRAARLARVSDPGTLLAVLADDPAAAVDVPAWARLKGHTVTDVEIDDQGGSVVTVRLAPGLQGPARVRTGRSTD